MIPVPSLVERHLFRRGARLWVLVRLTITGFIVMAGGAPIAIGTAATMAVVTLTVVIGFVEARRVSERVLLANLGLSVERQALLLGTAAALGEVLLRVGAAFA